MDRPEDKIENVRINLIDQALWDIELIEWLRNVIEPFVGEHGQKLSVRVVGPDREDQQATYKAYLSLREKERPKPKEKRIRSKLGKILSAFAYLDPYYVWTEVYRQDAE